MRRLFATSIVSAIVLAGCLEGGAADRASYDVEASPEAGVPEEVAPETSVPEPSEVDGVALSIDQREVAPQSTVALRIDTVTGVDAPTDVQWSVYLPYASTPTRLGAGLEITFEANFVGAYRFLAEYMREGHVVRLTNHLMVVAARGLHVELSWQTPGDPDETDTGSDPSQSVGSDVDVHLLAPSASDYFDDPLDCHWKNARPEWGAPGASDNPTLDRDDQDGAGPEIITLAQPEAGAVYKVGVHYWNDWGYGASRATIRIFMDGVLVDAWSDVELVSDDLWASHRISDGVVTRAGETPTITHSYTTRVQP